MKGCETTITLKDSIPDDDGSGFVLTTRRQLRSGKIMAFVVSFAILFTGCYLLSQLLILKGALKERADKECVSAIAINNWEKTLSMAQAICVDGQSNYSREIKESYEKQINKLEGEVKYWKDAYLWLKKQNGETTNKSSTGGENTRAEN